MHAVEGINRTMQLKEVLRKCMEAAKIVMNSEASSLMLLDEATGDLNVSIPTGPVKDEILGMTIPKTKGIGGWVVSYNQPFISNDVVESDIFWKDLSAGFTTRNIICVPLQNSEGEAFGVLQAINKKDGNHFEGKDVPVFESLAQHVASAIERSQKYDELERKLEERDLQLSEIHHRLKNNLSMISGLIEFDLVKIEDPIARGALISAEARIKSVAEAHSLLYEQNKTGELDLSEYLASVTRNVENVFQWPDKDIQISMHFEDIYLDVIRGMLCGLVLNELLMNAYKHAFVERSIGEIIISLKKTPTDKIVIIVADNGLGIMESTKNKQDKPDAHFISRSLANKLGAEISWKQNPEIGSTCIVSFQA
ncbi:MAG: histidine kinase dimerization/phosphoacceptor domain -containing protein [Gracilimonas sp.]